MNSPHRPLAIGPLRAFEAVARLLSFRGAAEELHLTQSAISRQIRSLEDEVGSPLILRGTRHVELSAAGATLLHAVLPFLERLDASVRQLRQGRGRPVVNLTTFASFASLWLIPRLEAFQRDHPDIDIRVSASEHLVELSDGEMDVALRYGLPARTTTNAQRLFGEVLTPVASPWLVPQATPQLTPPCAALPIWCTTPWPKKTINARAPITWAGGVG